MRGGRQEEAAEVTLTTRVSTSLESQVHLDVYFSGVDWTWQMVELELEVLGHYQEMASRLIGQCIQILHTPPQQHSRDGDIINNDSAQKILGHRKVM